MSEAIWWAIVTLTTVGYGDKYPLLYSGRCVAGCAALISILVLSMPMAILGIKFNFNFRLKCNQILLRLNREKRY
jgi:hypothetical protein